MKKLTKKLLKQLDELEFVACPTEEKQPFFWRWSKHGKDMLKIYISSVVKTTYQEATKETIKNVNNLITEELNIANKEGQPTSRLTSLAVKIIKLYE